MIFAGAIEVDPGVVFLILGILALVALAFAALGGAIAVGMAGQRRAFWLGAMACGGTTLMLARTLTAGTAAVVGLGASALVGWFYRKTGSDRHDEPS